MIFYMLAVLNKGFTKRFCNILSVQKPFLDCTLTKSAKNLNNSKTTKEQLKVE